MTALICPRCHHANPQEAQYCHHDGVLLEGVKEAQKTKFQFATPFVFKTGLTCNDFKSLGQGILAEWDESREMLAFAEWETFFTELGRVDLAQVASQARMFPDPDRGLDQLLSALPGFEADPGMLRINQRSLDFGTLQVGLTTKGTIRLENSGDRLVWGEAILKDAPWCSLSGEGPLADRSFQYIKNFDLDIQIPANNIRRSGRTLSGTLVVKTESEEISIQLVGKEPEVIPFDGELFLGATSPRQIAEKSRIKPREAVPLFMSGKVAQWYEANGWNYPVTGPTAPGMASVQQYFEAHGFAPAPKVEIEPPAILLSATPGESITQRLILKTTEKRHVFGYLLPTDAWIRVGELEPNYQTATIPLIFETQNLRPDEPLRTVLTVMANGQQRFEIPVEIQPLVPAAPMLDLDALAGTVDESESIESSPVELVEGESFDDDANLLEATFVNTHKPVQNPNTKSAATEQPNSNELIPARTPQSEPSLARLDSEQSKLFPTPTNTSFEVIDRPMTHTVANLSTRSVQIEVEPQRSQDHLLSNQRKTFKKLLVLGGSIGGTVLILILAMRFMWQGGERTLGKELVRPLIAGKPNSDLLAFTVETLDQDRISLLATESADTGSHLMLKSGNSTASVGSKKSSAKTVTKWETKDGWSHREIEIGVGGNKWRIGQWLHTLPKAPNQCAVLFELSPLERDSKIAARLALRPGTGSGNSVNLFLPDSSAPLIKPELLRAEKMPEKVLFSIDTPPTNGILGLDSPEILLPGKEKPSVPSRPTQMLIGQGLDSFGPWDCQFPELFDENPDPVSSNAQIGIDKKTSVAATLKDPFLSLYWEDATVRKGQKRLIGFTLGIANQEGTK